jgi:plastocyanin
MTAASIPLTTPPRAARAPLSALNKLTAGLLLVAGALLVYMMVAVFGSVIPPFVVFIVLGVVGAAAILRGRRWAPVLALLYGALFLAVNGHPIASELSQPGGATFVPVLLCAATALLSLALGGAALARNLRQGVSAPAPRWLAPSLAGFAGLCAGAIALSLVARPGAAAAAGVSPRVLATLPVVTTRDFAFQQPELRVKAGERVALRLENADAMQHSFDVDELDVHVPMPGRATAVALFTAGAPGRYTIYCAPHYDKRSGQGMKATLVVEP